MRRELTWQAVVCAAIVAALVSASYPYVVLKLGLGPNVSVVSAFLGAVLLLALAPRTRGQNRLMNNVVQTAGTSAASTAFICVAVAAVDLAAENPAMRANESAMNGVHTSMTPLAMFLFLCCTGGLGVLFIVPFRRHFLEDRRMVFADGVAAAETITVLDTPGGEGRGKLRLLGLAALASAVVNAMREFLASRLPSLFPEWYPTRSAASYAVGVEWNLLSVGTGLLIGLNVSLSMLAATLVVYATGPYLSSPQTGISRDIALSGFTAEARPRAEALIDTPWNDLSEDDQKFVRGEGGRTAVNYTRGNYFPVVLLWFMWPATALMITSAITAVLLQWRALVESFRRLREIGRQQGPREDVSMRTILIGGVLLTLVLAVVQNRNFGLSYAQTALAVICALPLILVCTRVLGETNNAPVSVMMNGLQAVFAVFWPASTGHNLVAAGLAGSTSVQGAGTMQDYKSGALIGSTPRVLTWVQLAAVPIGAAAVALMYPILKATYGIGEGLPTPTGIKVANMAVLLSQGLDALPRGAVSWTVVAAVVGVLLPLAHRYLRVEWLPSAAGFGFGLILPGVLNIPIALGGIAGWLWMRQHRPSYDRYAVTVASGLIAGEALLGGLVLPVVHTLLR
jgi:uncharacterized oligopeptide transporter (OPT) family protein